MDSLLRKITNIIKNNMDIKEKNIFIKTLPYFNKKPNIIDVGGNIGLWSESVLNIIKPNKLFIFEPENKNVKKLSEKFSKNSNIIITGKGLSDESNYKMYFDIVSDNVDVRGLGGFVKRQVYNNLTYKTYDFEVITLDSFFEKDIEIDYIKIDVEGFELNVMKGMCEMLSKSKLKFIQFEYGGTYLDANIKLNDVILYLNKFNYNVYDFKEGCFNKVINYIDDYEYNNFIASKIELNV